LLRKGGVEAEGLVRIMPDTQVDDAFEFDGTDTHFVTLPRMHKSIQETSMKYRSSNTEGTHHHEIPKLDDDTELPMTRGQTNRIKDHHFLPLPDSRILDHRLMLLLIAIETSRVDDTSEEDISDFWKKSNDVATILEVRKSVLFQFDGDAVNVMNEYSGVGLSSVQCGISHRTLNDGSDYSFGSASNQLSQLAYGTDAPRYLRALCVPMNITRFAISGLLYSDFSNVKAFMISERLRYFGKEDAGDASNKEPRNTDTVTTSVYSDESWMHSSSRPTLLAPIDPVETIAKAFRSNALLRASVCYTVALLGFPPTLAPSINAEYWTYTHGSNNSTAVDLFDLHKFRSSIFTLFPNIELPNTNVLHEYVEMILLPHCLRLCVYGNGPATRNARGSHGDYETAFGISVHPEPSLPQPSPIPDPCLPVQEHSLEAIGLANAILRRVRLLRSCIHLSSVDSILPINTLVAQAKSLPLCSCIHEMPVWWCPWIHDIALLLHAASHGLFSLIRDRSDHSVFSKGAIETLLRAEVAKSDTEETSKWCEQNAISFPSMYQVERRLGLLCGEATKDLSSEFRFDYIPMFDHGGWPRK
jgi:hypothetical protein